MARNVIKWAFVGIIIDFYIVTFNLTTTNLVLVDLLSTNLALSDLLKGNFHFSDLTSSNFDPVIYIPY